VQCGRRVRKLRRKFTPTNGPFTPGTCVERGAVAAQRDEIGLPVGASDCDETFCGNLADRLELGGHASICSRPHDSSIWCEMKHEHPVPGDNRDVRRE
jgi:hypothetical protein